MKRDGRSLRQVFGWPLLIGLASLAGLLAALVGDGLWDLLGCLVLLPPVLLSADGLRRAWPRRRRG